MVAERPSPQTKYWLGPQTRALIMLFNQIG